VRIFPLVDSYPSGDEFVMVNDITKRIIPPGGLPKDVGCVVMNVETLMNIGLDQPVTNKYLTVAGAVADPITVSVPIGITIGEVIEAAGGATVPDFGVLLGGAMMGNLATSLDQPVTKTLGGIIVLPADHSLIKRYKMPWAEIHQIGKSACDQCRFCTDLCPRYLLGHPIEPHAAMRALMFGTSNEQLVAATLYCCECNLCSLFVPGRSGSEKRLRAGQARRARAGAEVQRRPQRYRNASDEGLPARFDEAPDPQTGSGQLSQRRPADEGGFQSEKSSIAAQAAHRRAGDRDGEGGRQSEGRRSDRQARREGSGRAHSREHQRYGQQPSTVQ
jgi:Na+-translocating ferredoxin:NAD+ oxidoreductase RnfC subunit